MDDAGHVAALRELAAARVSPAPVTPPSRFAWFALGTAAGMLTSVLLYVIGVRVPVGLGYSEKPGMERLAVGMTYDQIVGVLGREDGTVRAAELVSFDRSLCRFCPPQMQFEEFETQGGRFLFWLSRSNGLLVMNVVALDADGKLYATATAFDTYLGMD